MKRKSAHWLMYILASLPLLASSPDRDSNHLTVPSLNSGLPLAKGELQDSTAYSIEIILPTYGTEPILTEGYGLALHAAGITGMAATPDGEAVMRISGPDGTAIIPIQAARNDQNTVLSGTLTGGQLQQLLSKQQKH